MGFVKYFKGKAIVSVVMISGRSFLSTKLSFTADKQTERCYLMVMKTFPFKEK